MAGVSTKDKYIGASIVNDLEVGDEVCIRLEDGPYFNMEVTHTHEPEAHEREVLLGDVERKHLYLVVDTNEYEEEVEYGSATRTRVEWDPWAYTIADDPDDPIDNEWDIAAMTIMGKDSMVPDMTLEEAKEEGGEGIEDDVGLEQFRKMRDELDYIIRQAEKVVENEITLRTYEQRIDALQVKHGGRLVMDEL